jgi:hypothetical protein
MEFAGRSQSLQEWKDIGYSSVFSLSNIFTSLTVLSPYNTYHHLMTRAQTAVSNWCKEQLFIPLIILYKLSEQ